ncbi:sulfatase [Wenyingzhuangia sp. 2_MG-2023]|uniref:sulfatase n=1 Tax=Wenyingzhuangia sp. 2_MG-2023 TaxID=3062639 RepID=UPI0026E43F79|nr:sulfatase [Wenyingzhuangia sp. 2_MG-2023]MDO6736312.1 sulfatase [Wenyingzhuangia sp. 2_MG-2023]MDO6801383.1 sulfatase [Wenyingzhuangia sp. 1_MG-2023]
MHLKKHLLLIIVSSISFIANAQKTSSYKDLKGNRPEPNIVLLLTDDLGWQDVKVYDIDEPSPYETPNIDAFAKKGVQFWQAYSPAPTCAPSRCAIMSGTHPARAQKTHVVGGAPPTVYASKDIQRVMDPWYSGRMPENEMTLARVLQQKGYTTGHTGKWHMAIDHFAYPQPTDQGFDVSTANRGVTIPQKPNRLTDFATNKKSDPYRLDENGFPFHQNSQDALTFIKENKQDPFFLYFATFLVHAPIHTRSKALLEKYCKKLGVAFPTDPNHWDLEGQNNPYYCAMVEMMDYYVGQIFNYLETTDDPRWPGHTLSENTYIIFTSDNGGMEGHPGEVFTDNYPLDKGKINAKEGGTRVPLIIAGPGIKKGIQSDVVVNGLDFYPTILSLLDVDKPSGKLLDGDDLSTLLLKDPTNPKLVTNKSGNKRTTMMWHFPHSSYQSTLRVGDYKFIRNYDYKNNPRTTEFELYRLYDSTQGTMNRLDIEEANNLATIDPKRTAEMNAQLTAMLTEMNASYPSYNPNYKGNIEHKETVPTVISETKKKKKVTFMYRENGAKVVKANLIYTTNGGNKYEEWFKTDAKIHADATVTAILPKGTTHYIINLIDENNFLVSYPEMPAIRDLRKEKKKYSGFALSAIH